MKVSYIAIAGMVGTGKSSLAMLLAQHYDSEAFYESVDDNPILPLFYTATEEEIQEKRYPFLLQLHFLNTRFKTIKDAQYDCLNVMDRSIKEDKLFARINYELGRISELEFDVYNHLFDNLNEEIEDPHTVIYLSGSFDTILSRIKRRGREYELDEGLIAYYKELWTRYDEWVFNNFNHSEIVVINIDSFDYVNNEDDKEMVLKLIDSCVKTKI